jgi:ribonuclease R
MPKKPAQFTLPSPAEILRRLGEKPYSLRQLLKALHLHAGQRTEFNRAIQVLVNEGRVARVKGGLLAATQPQDLIVGRISRKRLDYALLLPEHGEEQELFVDAGDLGDALPDDTVSARLLIGGRSGRDGRRPARVVRVLKRGHDRIVGTFHRQRQFGVITPENIRFTPDFAVPQEAAGAAKDGDKVVAAITAWPEGYVPGRAKIIEVLGQPDKAGMDITVIVRKFELPFAYSEAALAEARRVAQEPGPAETAGRTDLRDRRIVTIDGEDARDFDDAVDCQDRPGGGWRLGVHIADVSHYLPESTALDLETRERGTSVYFPDRALHMLPEPLSTGVCSLRPQVDRLTVSAILDVDPDGTVSHAEFFRSVIRSAARLTYNQVQHVLDEDGKGGNQPAAGKALDLPPALPYQVQDLDQEEIYSAEPAMEPQDGPNPADEFRVELRRLHQAAQALRRERERRGSLDFDLPEPKVILDQAGRVVTIQRRVQKASHRLIEDCMIAANEAVARYLARTDTPTLYRVHEPPAGEKFEELQQFLKAYRYELGPFSPRDAARAYQKLLRSWQGKPEEPVLNMALLRSLKLAVYQPRNLGHFGLGSRCYTHFASPIRRYPDLIVHRTLTARLAGPLPARKLSEWRERMPVWGEQLSFAERRAEKAEREAVAMKQAEFMADKLGEVFAGTISTVTNFGFFVTLEEHFVEGLVKLGSLEDDYYIFEERQRTLIGERHRRIFRTGDKVTIQVMRVNKEEGWVDFALYGQKLKRRGTHWRHPMRPVTHRGRKRR